MIIDSHQHFWHYDRKRFDWITDEMAVLQRDFLPRDLQVEYAAHGVDGCVAVQTEQSEIETNFLLALAAENAFIKGVVGWVDLRDANLRLRLEHFTQFEKLCGFRHIVQAEPDDNFLLGNEFLRGVRMLKEFNFTYDILIYPQQLPAAIKFVESNSDQALVIDHIAKPLIKDQILSPWREQMREIAQHEKVYCKVSGLVTEAAWHAWHGDDFKPYLDTVFDAFTADRLMFGSDWPVCLAAARFPQVKNLLENYMKDFPQAEKDKIFGLNAIQFYQLKV